MTNQGSQTELTRWNEAWAELGLTAPAGLLEELRHAYEEPQRAYHGLTHIRDCLVLFEEVRKTAERPAEITLAIWFHDAVYDPKAKDNEQRSADWAKSALREAGGPKALAARLEELVMATCHDALPSDPDARLLVDIDLSILGSEPKRFDAYEDEIRREYAWVSQPAYRAGRSKILRQFLDRRPLFQTPALQARLGGPRKAEPGPLSRPPGGAGPCLTGTGLGSFVCAELGLEPFQVR